MRLAKNCTGIIRHNMELELIPCKGGWSYQWHDQHGAVRCSGWLPSGDRHEAERVAIEILEAAVKGVTR